MSSPKSRDKTSFKFVMMARFVGHFDHVVRIFVSRLVKLGRGVNDIGDAEGLWAEINACTRPRPERARALLITFFKEHIFECIWKADLCFYI